MNWYVVNIKPKQDRIAILSLQRLGLETFYPKIREHRVIRRKKCLVSGPLFPGYCFARFNVALHYKAVHYAHGVRGLVSFGVSPARVEDEAIYSIKSRIEGDFIVIPPPAFQAGQSVRIQDGPFEGLEAIFEREMPAQQRVVLLLKMLSYQASIIVDRDCVALAAN